jgi:hypothetical protein
VAVDVDLFASQLMGAHLIAATLFKAPELGITEAEAKQLAKAIKSLMAQYSINVSAKSVALMQFVGTASAVYAPRMIFIAKRKSAESSKRKADTGIVTPVPTAVPPVPGAFDIPAPPTGSMKFN